MVLPWPEMWKICLKDTQPVAAELPFLLWNVGGLGGAVQVAGKGFAPPLLVRATRSQSSRGVQAMSSPAW